MTENNPYATSTTGTRPPAAKRSLLVRFVILNLVLIGIPIILALMTYGLLTLIGLQVSGIESSGSLGLVSNDVLWIILGYWLLPNLVLLAFWKFGRAR